MEEKLNCRLCNDIYSIYKTSELEKSEFAEPRTEFEVEDCITIKGSGLHFDMTDPQQGVFFGGKQGQLRCTEVYENNCGSVTVEIPEYLHCGDYTVEVRRKLDRRFEVQSFSEPVKVKGYMELYGLCIEDYWEKVGYKNGFLHGKWAGRNENKKIVVRKKNTVVNA